MAQYAKWMLQKLAPGHPTAVGHPEAGFISTDCRQPAPARLSEAGDDLAGVGPGGLYGVFAEAVQAVGHVCGIKSEVLGVEALASGTRSGSQARWCIRVGGGLN